MMKITLPKYLFADLIKALKEYRDYQRYYEKSSKDMLQVKEHIEKLVNTSSTKKRHLWISLEDIFESKLNPELIKQYKEMSQKMKEDPRTGYWATIVKQLEYKQQMVKDVKKKLTFKERKILQHHASILNDSGKTLELARKVGRRSKKVYDLLYRKLAKRGSNACREFIL